jgi:hypothetical protein
LDGTASFACLFQSRNLLIRVQIPDTAFLEQKGDSKAKPLLPPLVIFLWKDLYKKSINGVLT